MPVVSKFAPETTLLALLAMLMASNSPRSEQQFANGAIREIITLLRGIKVGTPLYHHLSEFTYRLNRRTITSATPGAMSEYVTTVLRTMGNFANKPTFKVEATALVTACRKAETAYAELVEKTDDARSRVQWEKTLKKKSSDPTKNPFTEGGGFAALGDEEDGTDSSGEDGAETTAAPETPKTKKHGSSSPRAPTKEKAPSTPRALMEPPSTPGAPIKAVPMERFDWGDSDSDSDSDSEEE